MVLIDLSKYSGLPVSMLSFLVSEPSGESLGSEDSTRSIHIISEDKSLVSHLESILEFPVIQAFVHQNNEQDLR